MSGTTRRKRDLHAYLLALLSSELEQVAERWEREGVRTRREIKEDEKRAERERRRAQEEERVKRMGQKERRCEWWGDDALTEEGKEKERQKKKEERCIWWGETTPQRERSNNPRLNPQPRARHPASKTIQHTTTPS